MRAVVTLPSPQAVQPGRPSLPRCQSPIQIRMARPPRKFGRLQGLIHKRSRAQCQMISDLQAASPCLAQDEVERTTHPRRHLPPRPTRISELSVAGVDPWPNPRLSRVFSQVAHRAGQETMGLVPEGSLPELEPRSAGSAVSTVMEMRVSRGAAVLSPKPIEAPSSKSVSMPTVILSSAKPSETANCFNPIDTQPTTAARPKNPGVGPPSSPPMMAGISITAVSSPCANSQRKPSLTTAVA